MSNMIDALKEYMTSDLLNKAVEETGEEKSALLKGLNGLIPTVLGGLIQKSSDAGAFSSIFNMLKDDKNDGWLDNLGGLIGGGNIAHGDPKDAAGGLMSKVFGSKMGGILDIISTVAGIKKGSTSTLLGLVGPMIMSYLGRKIRKGGLDAMGLTKLLGEQSSHVAKALPAGMGDLLGYTTKTVAHETGSSRTVETGTSRSTITKRETETVTASTGGSPKWLWPLLLGLAALLGFWFFRGCNKPNIETPTVEMPKIDVPTIETEKAKEVVSEAASSAAAAVAGLIKKTVCGIELNVMETGVENQVVGFITDASKPVDKTTWFSFDRLTFETGSANLDMAKSEEQLNNIAQIMKCYPNVKLKIGGYTDNVGSEASNMKLSTDRANNVMAALVAKGVAQDRLAAEGYGPQHPVADNATEEGKAKNRRIDVRVSAK